MPDKHITELECAKLEELSIEELETMLQDDFDLCNEQGPDIAYTMGIIDALQKKQKMLDPTSSTEDAWRDFLENYKEQSSILDIEVSQKKPIQRDSFGQTMRRTSRVWKIKALIAIAALLCITFVAVINQVSLFEAKEEPYRAITSQSAINEKINQNIQIESLLEEISKHSSIPVVPQWYPANTSLEDVQTTSNTGITAIVGDFHLNENSFSILITIYDPSIETPPLTIENSENVSIVEYEIKGITHYILSSASTLKACWQNGNVECIIQGTLAMEDLQRMLHSIYE